jgi:anti-anti-sigma factor
MRTGRGQRDQSDTSDLILLRTDVQNGGRAVVTISGELDLATAERTVRYVREVIDQYQGLVSADLSGLVFCDACGLGALIRIAAHAERSGRRIELTKPTPALVRLMRITGAADRLLTPALALSTGVPQQGAGPAS